MKTVLVSVVAVVVLIAAGLIVFLKVFDLDQYRPFLTEKIKEATGKPVELRRLAFTWHDGLAVELNDFGLFSTSDKKSRPKAQLQQAAAVVRLWPLLRKEVRVSSVILTEPELDVERGTDGSFTVAGIKLTSNAVYKAFAAVANREDSLFSMASAEAFDQENMPLSIDLIRIIDGKIFFHDSSGSIPLDWVITSADVTIKNFSFTTPASFKIKAAVLSADQNVVISGQFEMPAKGRRAMLTNVQIKSNLGMLNLPRAAKIFPVLNTVRSQDGLAGDLQINVDHFILGGQGLKSARASLYLKEGKILFKDLQSPMEDLNMEAFLQRDKADIREMSANFSKGTIKISGTIDLLTTQPRLDLHAFFQNLAMDTVMPVAAKGAPSLTGRLSGIFQGSASGTDWSQISQSLSGYGRLALKDGVFLNYNIFRTVVEKISEIPGARDALQENLPMDYRVKFNEPSTILMPVNLSFTINSSRAHFDNFALATDLFSINGVGGEFSLLNNNLYAKTVLKMNPRTSQTLIKTAPEVQILANSKGLIEIPLTLEGTFPNVTVTPDVEGLTSKIAIAQTEEMVGNILNKPGQSVSELERLLDKKLQGSQKE